VSTRLTIADRIARHALIEDGGDGCWLWTRSKTRSGYAQAIVDGKHTRMHRASYELHYGPIPDGMVIDHLCRVRHCVNPLHLEAVTHAENMKRGERATATHCKSGHEFTIQNTILKPRKDGGQSRQCRKCQARWTAESRARRAEEAGAA